MNKSNLFDLEYVFRGGSSEVKSLEISYSSSHSASLKITSESRNEANEMCNYEIWENEFESKA